MTSPNSDTRPDSEGQRLNDDMILVPIILRADGITARVHFPANLTDAEADKIARVIMAYAAPENPS